MKKNALFFATASLSTLMGIWGGCSKKTLKDTAVTLIMAEVNPADTIAGQMDYAFKQKVEELSNGTITIDLQCSGILGDELQVLNLMLNPGSTIQMYRASSLSFAPYNCEKIAALNTPYTFTSKEHFWSFAKTDTAKEILAEPLEKGMAIRGLFYGEEGFRHFFSRTPLKSVSDFSGLKIRTTNDAVMNAVVEGLGATPVSVPFTTLYSALQTGEVDGAEQPMANYLSNHFPEVAPYMILDGHTLGIMMTLITEEAWQSLSPSQQAILHAAGEYASDFCRRLSWEKEMQVRAQLEKEGATIIDVTDTASWQTACENVITQETAQMPALHQAMLNANQGF